MAKRALLCGCNYPNTNATLRGCINDCLSMKGLLMDFYGFQERDIELMLDTDSSTVHPTGANIKAKLRELVAASKPGDVLFFHFSGHGTQVPDDEESDGFDEAICPTDMNVICDDDLRDIFSHLDRGVKLSVVCDCCHSGTLLDHSEVVISGPKAGEAVPNVNIGGLLAGLLAGGREAGGGGTRDIRNRALPTNDFLGLLSAKLGGAVGKGNIRDSLVKVFGNSASAKAVNYQALAAQGLAALQAAQKGNYAGCMPFLSGLFAACTGGGGGGGAPAAAPAAPGEPALNIQHTPTAAGGGQGEKLGDDVGILISGCQAHETSADACPSGNAKEAYGALSNGIRAVVTAHHQQNPGAPISYRTLVTGVRDALAKAGFSQNPCLEASQANADSPFLLH